VEGAARRSRTAACWGAVLEAEVGRRSRMEACLVVIRVAEDRSTCQGMEEEAHLEQEACHHWEGHHHGYGRGSESAVQTWAWAR
jgi:hypothetical protein